MAYICTIFRQISSPLGMDPHEEFLVTTKTCNGASFDMLQLPSEEVSTME